jgi:hypothetical protein
MVSCAPSYHIASYYRRRKVKSFDFLFCLGIQILLRSLKEYKWGRWRLRFFSPPKAKIFWVVWYFKSTIAGIRILKRRTLLAFLAFTTSHVTVRLVQYIGQYTVHSTAQYLFWRRKHALCCFAVFTVTTEYCAMSVGGAEFRIQYDDWTPFQQFCSSSHEWEKQRYIEVV